jgi:hypothetical protein
MALYVVYPFLHLSWRPEMKTNFGEQIGPLEQVRSPCHVVLTDDRIALFGVSRRRWKSGTQLVFTRPAGGSCH